MWIQKSLLGADQTTILRPSWKTNELWYGWMDEPMNDDLSTHVVLFQISGSLAKRAAWKQTSPNKKNTNKKHKNTFYLVQTKALELADFPGVNTLESQTQSITHPHVDIFNETWEISVPPLKYKCKYSKWKFKRTCLTCKNQWGLMKRGLLLQFLYDLLEA